MNMDIPNAAIAEKINRQMIYLCDFIVPMYLIIHP